VDKFYPSGLDAKSMEPGSRIIGPLVGSHGSFQVLAGLLCAREHQHSLSAASKRFEQMMRFDLAGAWYRYKAETRP
jgi:hypothetical protein